MRGTAVGVEPLARALCERVAVKPAASGMPLAQLVRRLGTSRQTAYAILKRNGFEPQG